MMILSSATRHVPWRQLARTTDTGPKYYSTQALSYQARLQAHSNPAIPISFVINKNSAITTNTNKPHHHQFPRTIHTTTALKMATSHDMTNNNTSKPKNDWSATQYLKFNNERTRPVHDLINRITPHLQTSTPRIYDLGCGPGNSASILLSAFPNATLTGVDNSPDMLRKARTTVPNATFLEADLTTFTLPPPVEEPSAGEGGGGGRPEGGADLIFSNAAYHWLRHTHRIPTLTKLLISLSPGSILALQVPDNYTQPTHALMRAVALAPSQPWSAYFSPPTTAIGDLSDATRPDLDPIEPPAEWYAAFAPHAATVDIWRTAYVHVLADAAAIVEWVKGTGLLPFLRRMPEEGGVREAFLSAYEERLKEAYPRLGGEGEGRVLLEYPRLFLVVVRK